MRRTLILMVSMMTIMALAPAAFAGEGGKPAAHGLEGREWGRAVSDLATSAPGAVADHIKEQKATILDESEGTEDGPKGNAYGWRIKDAFGMSYGQVLKAYKAAFDDPAYMGPHGESEPLPVVGAKAFWLAHEMLL